MERLDSYKVVLLGDSTVGKSSLAFRIKHKKFDHVSQPTIGCEFFAYIHSKNGERIKLMIWDTAGQERFRTITSSYYKGAHGIMIVYDVTNRESFRNIRSWMSEVDNYA